MRNILLKILIFFPCTAMGIINFSFDTENIESSSLICIKAAYDDNTTKSIESIILDKDIKEAYILVEHELNIKYDREAYNHFYKLLVVDDNGVIYRYKFRWDLYNKKVIKDSMRLVLEKNTIPFCYRTLNEFSSNEVFKIFRKCANCKLDKYSRCLKYKYRVYDDYGDEDDFLVIMKQSLIVDYYNSWDHETIKAEDQDVVEKVRKHFEVLNVKDKVSRSCNMNINIDIGKSYQRFIVF